MLFGLAFHLHHMLMQRMLKQSIMSINPGGPDTYSVILQLLTFGAKVDATGRKGRTALHQLLKHGDLLDAKLLNLLLHAGANPFFADDSGELLLCQPSAYSCVLTPEVDNVTH